MSLFRPASACLALAVVSVGACTEPQPTPAPAPVEARLLAGVNLDQDIRVLGTEPFWAVEITPVALVYSGVKRPEQRAANPGPSLQGTVATWTTATAQGAPLVITVSATECSDGMSDRVYPLAARVEIGEETLTGCAASAAAIAGAGEQGPVG